MNDRRNRALVTDLFPLSAPKPRDEKIIVTNFAPGLSFFLVWTALVLHG
jgi:hypothetical protein